MNDPRPAADLDTDAGPPAGLLAVFAHPDDEQFGTAGALLACVKRGVPVQVLCATRGDAGEIADPSFATPETLGTVREAELRDACDLLGFAAPIVWDYRDGHLAEVDPERLATEIAEIIRRLRPCVVLTFDANGGYGHPDHMIIHQATRAAIDLAAVGTGYRPDKIYVTAYPRSRREQMTRDLVAHGFPSLDFGSVQTIAADQIGTADELVTTAVDVDHLWDERWASLRAHRTQYGGASLFARLPEDVVRAWLATDYFVRLTPPAAPGAALPDEDDLWAGLPLPR